MLKRLFILAHRTARQMATEAIWNAPDGHAVIIQEPNRTLDQNAAQWPYLQAFADQLEWPVNGRLRQLTSDEWKDVLTSAFRRESVQLAQALEGDGVVMLGARTSAMSKREFSEWIEFLKATAAMRGVVVYDRYSA